MHLMLCMPRHETVGTHRQIRATLDCAHDYHCTLTKSFRNRWFRR